MKATLVYAYDWQGLYIDGILQRENHSLGARDVLEVMQQFSADIGDGAVVDSVETIEANQEWLEDRGELPVHLEDVRPA